MKILKRVLLLCLITVILSAYNVGYAETGKSSEKDKNIVLLNKLGLNALDSQSGDTELTRSELAYIAYGLKSGGVELADYEASNESFSDVSTATEFYSYINMSYDANIIYGMGDGTFMPNGTVSINDITTVLLRTAGYGQVLNDIGNAASIPQTSELLDGVTAKNSSKITLGEAAKIAVNALDINIMLDENRDVTISSKTVLNRSFGLYYKDGIYYTGRAAQAAEKYVMLDGKLYETEDVLNYDELNGYKVRAYIRQKDDVVEFIDDTRFSNKTYVVDPEDIISVSQDYIFFYNEDNKKDSISLKDITEIYNGVAEDFEANDFSFDNGRVVFVAPGGGNYTTARIERYDTFVVGAVSEETAYDFYDPLIKLDLGDSNDTKIFIDGSQVSGADIQKNDVLSVARTKDEQESVIYVSRRNVSGTVTQINEDNIEIDGRKLYHTRYFVQNQTELLMGSSVIIAVDYFGRAAAVLKYSADSFTYGYLAKVLASESDVNTPVLKVYQDDGKFYTYELCDKLTVNGKGVKNASLNKANDFLTAIRTKVSFENGVRKETLMMDYVAQVIKFKVGKDGKINNLDTAIENPNETEASLRLHGNISNTGFRSGANQLAFSYIIDSQKTAAFYVPDSILNTFDSDGRVDEEKRNSVANDAFRVANSSIFQSGTKYDAGGYDVSDGGVAGALVIDNKSAGSANMIKVDSESAVVLIEKVSETLNRDDEISYGVTYWQNGTQRYNVVAYPEEFLKDPDDPSSVPKAGDILQLSVDLDDEINGFTVRYDNENNILTTGWDDCQCFIGYCYSYDDRGIIMTENADGTGEVKIFSSIYLLNNTYVYDTGGERGIKSVRKGTLADLRAFKDYMTESSKIFVRGTYYNPATLVIYE